MTHSNMTRSARVNLALSDEQVFLREAARGTLSRFKTFEAAREALDGDERRAARPVAGGEEAGWPGLLIDEQHGGAGLDAFDAMLVLGECGRVLAPDRAARASAGHRDPQRLAERAEPRCSSRWPPASAGPPTCPPARPTTCSSAGASTRHSGIERAAAPTAERRRRRA